MPERVERQIAGPGVGRARAAGPAPEKRRGTGRTSRGRESRRQLLDAARVVFERDGFLHARVADICDIAGMSHGSFYTYFFSKEMIFKEVVDSVELNLLTVDLAPADVDPIERVRAANRHYLKTYAVNSKIINVINQVATIDAEVRETRLQRQEAFARAIERRTRLLQEANLADPAVDAAYAAQALGGMVANFADFLFNAKNSFDFETAVDQLTLIWINALGIRRPPTDGKSAQDD